MPDPNPIISAAADRAAASPLEGSDMLKDAADLATKVAGGDWAEGLLPLGSMVYESKDLLADPLAKLASMGLGWVIEFFGPLRGLLDQLTGNQEQLNLIVETWSGIAGEMSTAADDLHAVYTADTAGWTGPAVAQYRLFCANQVDLYRAASASATSVADTARMSGMALTVVREIVRGLVTDAVGKAISIACRYPPPTTPAAAPEITTAITNTGNKIVQWLRKLKRAFDNAMDMLRKSGGLFRNIRAGLKTATQFPNQANGIKLGAMVFEEAAAIVGDAAKQAVKEIPGQLPEMAAVELAKGAAGTATANDPEPSQLYDGPGPHRVTGNL
jgi:hypothetical protein